MKANLIVTREQATDGLLPVQHLSYSALRCYLESENLFYKRYVRLEFDDKEKPAMLVGKAAHETIEKFWNDLGNAEAKPDEEYQAIADGILSRMLNEARQKAAERLGILPATGDCETVEATIEQKALIEAEAIQWSKTVDEAKAREQLKTAVANYLSQAEIHTDTVATEVMEKVFFNDLEGAPMPLPLKGVLDRILRHPELGEGLEDYKIVTSFSNPDERNAGYELQAAAFYFVFQGIRGYAPKFATFTETLKKECGLVLKTDPTRKLLQADLRALCDEHGLGWEKFEKNSDLQNKLAEAGILVRESPVQRITYDFEERRDILEAFIEVYKRVVNRLGFVALYEIPYDELPNPFSDFNGQEAWKDFTEGIGQDFDAKKRCEIDGAHLAEVPDIDF